jgi:hypothetical protein
MRASIATVRRHGEINNFASFKIGTGACRRGHTHQTKRYTRCQWCVKGNGASVGALDDGKRTNNGTIGLGSSNLPNRLRGSKEE